MILCRMESLVWHIESDFWETIFSSFWLLQLMMVIRYPLFRLSVMLETKQNTTECSLQASLVSTVCHLLDLGERWFNSEPATFKIGGSRSYCITCSKGESLRGGCWNQDALRAQTQCWTHMDVPADGLLLLSFLLQATQSASVFPLSPKDYEWFICLCFFFFFF